MPSSSRKQIDVRLDDRPAGRIVTVIIANPARLNAMHVQYPKTPWVVTFSYSRATQQPALDLWKGKDENVEAAQKALYRRAKLTGLARSGEYRPEMEKA